MKNRKNRNNRSLGQVIIHILMVMILMVSVIYVPALSGTFIAPYANAESGRELRQGDRLTITDGSWCEEFIVLNPEKTNTRKPGIFLLSNDYSDTTEFNYEDADLESANEWEGSKAQEWCTDYYRSMPESVRNSVIGVKTVETESGFKWAGVNNIDGTRTGRDKDKDKVFFLSYIEYDSNKDGANITPGGKWFLRSPYACGDLKVYVCVVTEDGSIHDFGTSWPAVLGARPAFNIDPALADSCSACRHGDKVKWIVQGSDAPGQNAAAPAYKWSADNRTCTGNAVCSNCGAEITETVPVLQAVVKRATVTAPGEVRYIASFKDEAFKTQTKSVKTSLTEVKNKKLPKVIHKKPSGKKKSVKLRWKKLSKKDRKKVDGIEILVSTDSKFRKNLIIKTAKKTAASYKVKGLRKGKKYWVKVRTYKQKGNTLDVGKWSKSYKVKTR